MKALEVSLPKYKDLKPNGFYDLQNFKRLFEVALKLQAEIFDRVGYYWTKWHKFYFFPNDVKKKNGIYVHGVISENGDIDLGSRYIQEVSKPIGQIAAKEEAAGKLRLFAIVDS